MAKQDINTELKPDEFSRIFDEYRAKIEEITRRTANNIQSIDSKPGENPADDHEHIEVVSASSQTAPSAEGNVQAQLENVLFQKAEPALKPEAATNDVEVKAESVPVPPGQESQAAEDTNLWIEDEHPVPGESAKIINEARHEAKKIIQEAEESAKKEAKKRTQSQVEKILEKARKEAEETIANANKSAEKVRDEVIDESKREADLIIREITQKYRQDIDARSSQVMAEAREKANNMLADISATTTQIGKHISEIVNRAKQTTSELETTMQAEVTELTKIITEMQSKLEEVGKTAPVENVKPSGKDNSKSTEKDNNKSADKDTNKTVDKDNNKSTDKENSKPSGKDNFFNVFKGNIKMAGKENNKTNSKEENKPVPPPVSKPSSVAKFVPLTTPNLSIRLIGEKHKGNNGNGPLFTGQMEMKSSSESFDYQYLKKLKKFLVHIPKIKYLQEYASEKEMSVVFDVLEPLPIVEILRNIPIVDEVITRADDDICLVFKTTDFNI